jgi:hypothetical protein
VIFQPLKLSIDGCERVRCRDERDSNTAVADARG